MHESGNRPGRERTLESLLQLVAALDRRAPHPMGSVGPGATEASGLRAEATLRIDRLHRATHEADDAQARSDDAMSDDVAPVAEGKRG